MAKNFDWQGYNLTAWDPKGLSDHNLVVRGLDYAKAQGSNFLAIDWAVNFNADGSRAAPISTPPLSDIQFTIAEAKARGLTVFLKPHSTKAENSENLNMWTIDPAIFSNEKFLRDWNSYLVDLSKFAQNNNVDGIFIGTEINNVDTSNRALWSEIITNVRNNFKGQLSYDALFNVNSSMKDVGEVAFWDLLDFISISMYLPLTNSAAFQYKDLLNAWHSNPFGDIGNVIENLHALSQKYKKPIFFAESGYQSVSDALYNTNSYPSLQKTINYDVQSLGLSALLDTWQKEKSDWMKGLSIWQITPKLLTNEGLKSIGHTMEFSTYGKPSSVVVAAAFGGNNYLNTINDKVFNGTSGDNNIHLYGLPNFISNNAPKTLADTFQNTVVFNIDGTIINNKAPTLKFFINDQDYGTISLSTYRTTSTYINPNGIPYSESQNIAFTIPTGDIKNIKIEIVNSDNIQNSAFTVHSLSINNVSITDASVFGKNNNFLFSKSSKNDQFGNIIAPAISDSTLGGYIQFDCAPYINSISQIAGSKANPFIVNGNGGVDNVYVIGRMKDYSFNSMSVNEFSIIETVGLNQNAIFKDVHSVVFQDGVAFNSTANSANMIIRTQGLSNEVTVTLNGHSDTFSNISRVKFSDKLFAVDIQGNAGQAYRLYQAALDRTPDERGLAGWIKFMDEGGSLTAMSQQFIDSQEFKTKYGALDNSKFVNQLYLNVLDRNGEPAGIAGWVNGLANGLSRAEVLKGFSESSENQANVIGQIKNGIPYVEWWLA